MKKFLLILTSLLLVVTSCGNDNSQKQSKKKETLIVGVSADYPPFEFIKNKKIVGLDIDVAHSIVKELGYKLYIKDINFDSLIPALQTGRVDFIISAVSETPERAKNVDFSVPYFTPTLAIVYRKDAPIKNLKDLSNKSIAAQSGSIMESFLRDNAKEIPNIDIISLSKNPQMIEELKIGRVDGVILETSPAKAFVNKNKKLDFLTLEDKEGQYSIGFVKNSPLKDKFNDVIIAMRDSGKLDDIKRKWLNGY